MSFYLDFFIIFIYLCMLPFNALRSDPIHPFHRSRLTHSFCQPLYSEHDYLFSINFACDYLFIQQPTATSSRVATMYDVWYFFSFHIPYIISIQHKYMIIISHSVCMWVYPQHTTQLNVVMSYPSFCEGNLLQSIKCSYILFTPCDLQDLISLLFQLRHIAPHVGSEKYSLSEEVFKNCIDPESQHLYLYMIWMNACIYFHISSSFGSDIQQSSNHNHIIISVENL